MIRPEWRDLVGLVRDIYGPDDFIPLHAPRFRGNEKKYLAECIDTTFVSSVGEFVNRFEEMCAGYTGAAHAVATVNGTAGLHVALGLAGVGYDTEVLTQPLTFVATANAISYTGATPVFLDVDRDTLGLSPSAVRNFLVANAEKTESGCRNLTTGRFIRACVPMHTFGHPCRITELQELCAEYGIALVEDAAESLGSFVDGRHTGTFGESGLLSFNGNKTITCGGGGMILTDDPETARRAKHLTTTGKTPHPWEYHHDLVAYNYRLTNLSAALGCAQIERLDEILEAKRGVAGRYRDFCDGTPLEFVAEPEGARSNFWLNAVLLASREERDRFLDFTNGEGVMTRPAWTLMTELPMYRECPAGPLKNSEDLADRLVNLPSSEP